MRRAALLLLGLLAPGLLHAQSGYRMRLYFDELENTTDSAYVVQAGATFNILVRANDNASRGLAAFTFRIYYDPALISFASARSSCQDSVASPLGTPVTGPNYVELSAGSCQTLFNATVHDVATVQLRLAGGATMGTGLYLEPRALTDRFAIDRSMDGDGDVDEVCLAVGIYGDVDADGLVNSRDALIALSNAVGLPTPGFFISRGDVDRDGYVGSRDALGMLQASIGRAPAYGFVTGRGIATACAPQAVLPRAVYYVRYGPMPGLPGVSGLVIRAANDSAETIAGDSAEANGNAFQHPRVSPDGSKVLFSCYWQYYYDVCLANADGTGLVSLTAGSGAYHYTPDWSPAGDSIVFVRNGEIWVMAADGLNQHVIPSSPSSVYGVAWDPRPGSRRIAYTEYSVFPGSVRTREIDSATTDSLVATGTSYSYEPLVVDWSPAGDSLVYSLLLNGYRATMVASRAGGTPARVARFSNLSSSETWPAWTDQGIFVTSVLYYPYPGRLRIFLLRPNGTVTRLRRSDTQDNYAAGMDKQ